MKKYKEIKASDELPGVGIYNCLYNGDHCIFQVHDGGFRIINYHGEKEDAPKLNLVKWLKEDEQDEGWVPVAKRLSELRPLHIAPYNLGDMGEIDELIHKLAKMLPATKD